MFLSRLRAWSWIPVLALATALRVWHLDWGLPDVEEEALPAKKAFEMWGWAGGHVQLDPQTAGWPAFSFYFHLALQKLGVLVQRMRGVYDDPYDYFVAHQLDPSWTILLGRSSSVLASLVVVGMGYVVARRLAGTTAAAVVGTSLALSPFLVEHAQRITPDILLTAFSALALWFLLRVHDQGRVRDYVGAGVAVGLGAACKYTPVLLAISLYATHLLRLRAEGRSLRRGGLDDRRLALAAVVSLASFWAASPYTLLSLEVVRRDFAYQALHMSEGHFGHDSLGWGWFYFLRSVFPHALGWPGFALAAAALAWAAVRRRGAWLVVVFAWLPFFTILGGLSTRFDRYMLPAVLPLSLGLAAGVVLLQERFASRPTLSRVLLVLALLGLTIPLASRVRAYHHLQATRSTQQLAAEWVRKNVDPERETFVCEMYGPELPRDRRLEWQVDPAFARLDEAQRQLLLEQPFYHFQVLPLYSTRATFSAYYYDLRHFLSYSYVITSGAVRRRYEADPVRFARQVEFYRDLDRYAEEVARFEASRDARGPRIRVYALNDTSRRAILAAKGKLAADEHLRWADSLHQDHLEAFFDGVGAHASVMGRFDVAADYYGKLADISEGPIRRQAFERMAESRVRAGQYEEAERLFRSLLEREPRSAYALGNLGSIAEEQGRPQEALRYYERCIEASGDDPQAGVWARDRLRRLRQRLPELQ